MSPQRIIFASIALCGACQLQLDRRMSNLDSPRVLAIRFEPPEAPPNTRVRASALVAGPDGQLNATGTWSLCTQRPAVAGYNSTADSCASGAATNDVGIGDAVDFSIPSNACAQFGSEPPSVSGNEPPIRAFDPDLTGGYYQPVRLASGDVRGLGGVRIACALFQATAENARAFREQYRNNNNPVLLEFAVPDVVERNVEIPVGVRTDEPEDYVAYDISSRQVVPRKERLNASWYAARGQWQAEVTTGSSQLTNTFIAPSTTGIAHVFVVLRDDRGGVVYATRTINVR